MKAAVIFGLNAPSDGNGLIDLANQSGIQYDTYHENSEIIKPYDVYLSHSYGVYAALQNILKFPDYQVKYWSGIDGVTKTWWPFKMDEPGKYFNIPKNVLAADFFQRDYGIFNFIPPSSRILNLRQGLVNYKIGWMSHGSAPRHPTVVQNTLKSLKGIQ